MGKKCLNCRFEVEEDHNGPCPSCKQKKGYQFSRSVTDNIKISDAVEIDLKKAGLDPNRILEISKMLKTQNKEIERVMLPMVKMLKNDKIKELHRQIKSINDVVSTQTIRLKKLDFQVSGLPKKDIDELKTIQENVDEQKKISDSTLIELLKDIKIMLEKQHHEQKDMHKKTHDRLSPKATIGLALVASILGAVIYGFINPFVLSIFG